MATRHSAKVPSVLIPLFVKKDRRDQVVTPSLPPCSSDSSLLHLLAPTPIPPPGLPLPITYLSLGCLGVGAPSENSNYLAF